MLLLYSIIKEKTVILGDRIITIRERLWQNVQLAAGVQIGTFAVFVGMVLLAPSHSPWLIPIFSLGMLTGVYQKTWV
jgi:hypothetical protein